MTLTHKYKRDAKGWILVRICGKEDEANMHRGKMFVRMALPLNQATIICTGNVLERYYLEQYSGASITC
jgi:hypothetical protein